MKNTILITGAAGFIGSALARSHWDFNDKVVLIDNIDINSDTPESKIAKMRTNHLSNMQMETFRKCDIRDIKQLENLFQLYNFDYVVHLAAKTGVRDSILNPMQYWETNVMGFANILEMCKRFQVGHLIYASSSSVYGSDSVIPFKEDEPCNNPMSIYAATKKANEMAAYSYANSYNLRSTGLRFFTVFGEMSRLDMAPYKFTKAILNDESIELYNYGKNTRDYTYIDDVVAFIHATINETIHTKSLLPAIPHQVYNVGYGAPITSLQFVEQLEKQIGKKALLVMKEAQIGDMLHTYASSANMTLKQRLALGINRYTGEDRQIWMDNCLQRLINYVKLFQTM
jgi:UDP-glucuronate 4-epimerase